MATGGKAPSGSNRGGKDRAAREARERARLYQARATLHQGQQRRRVRDNVIAGVVGGILIAGVIGGQIAYYAFGPGVPAPSPTGTPTPTPTMTVPVSPSPDPSATP